jgi:hypothetical protein
MFGYEAAVLLGPPDVSLLTTEESDDLPDDAVRAAAAESARFLMSAERTNVGPHTLEEFGAELRRIVTVYPSRPVYPLFVQLRELRDHSFRLLEGHQYPNQTRDLYLIAGTACGVLANASFDLGDLAAAETQARTAFLCAELAGHNGLRAWIRGTRALVAYWDDRPRVALDLAIDGSRYTPEAGTALVRLASIEARTRALADRTDVSGVEAALHRAEQAREGASRDEPGGMMAFPEAKQAFYAATARLWMGGVEAVKQAERDAERSVMAYERAAPQDQRLGELSLARLDLGAARMRADLNGTAQQVRAVLDASANRPTDSVARRLRQVAAALNQRPYQGSRLAGTLRQEISTRVDRAATPALPAGNA